MRELKKNGVVPREPAHNGIRTAGVGKIYHFGQGQAFRLIRDLRTGTLRFRRVKSKDLPR